VLAGLVPRREDRKHYNYFRDYDPAIGRYLATDPIWLIDDLNLYAYVAGSPINWADPLGTQANSHDGSKGRPGRERPDPRPIRPGPSKSSSERAKCYSDCVEIERKVWRDKHVVTCVVSTFFGGVIGFVVGGGPAGAAMGAGIGFSVGSTPGIGYMLGASSRCASDCGI